MTLNVPWLCFASAEALVPSPAVSLHGVSFLALHAAQYAGGAMYIHASNVEVESSSFKSCSAIEVIGDLNFSSTVSCREQGHVPQSLPCASPREELYW